MASCRFLAITLWAITVICVSANRVQQPLRVGEPGVLRRFAVNSSHTLEEVVRLAEDHGLDVWQVAPSHIDIYSPPAASPLPASLHTLPHSASAISTTAHHAPRAAAVDWNLTSLENSTFHAAYHTLSEVDAFIHALAEQYPDVVRTVRLGHSGEGREMLGVTIAAAARPGKRGAKAKSRPGFVITGAQHAREWVATASALYLAHALAANSSEPHSLSSLLDSFDFHIIPSPNPDGYDYTWETDRFWYKNRMVTSPHAKCVGLDMNRNWGYKWKRQPVSGDLKPKTPVDPCSHWYPGTRPFEAPEVNNLANYVAALPDVRAFIDLRSYGQMLSAPYSYTCKRVTKDAEDQLEAALGAAHALKLIHGTSFMTGTLCSLLYRAPGNIVDWMYARAGIKYSFAAHLRDTGTYGFALPPEWIRPVGEETARMVDYLARFIISQKK